MRGISVPLALLGLMIASGARADCCRLVKIDAETPPILVRACEPTPEAACGNVLFLGTLALNDSQNVCTDGQTIVYELYDSASSAFGPPIVAVCGGGDVEL